MAELTFEQMEFLFYHPIRERELLEDPNPGGGFSRVLFTPEKDLVILVDHQDRWSGFRAYRGCKYAVSNLKKTFRTPPTTRVSLGEHPDVEVDHLYQVRELALAGVRYRCPNGGACGEETWFWEIAGIPVLILTHAGERTFRVDVRVAPDRWGSYWTIPEDLALYLMGRLVEGEKPQNIII